MKFAPVMPPDLYPVFDKSDYHMVQATMLGRSRKACAWFRNLPKHHTVIADNGVIETGYADFRALRMAAKIIQPDIVICPDAFNDADKSIALCRQYFKRCTYLAPGVMIVPHGANITDWVMCAIEMLVAIRPWRSRHSALHIGVPKVLDTMEGRRFAAIDKLLSAVSIEPHQLHLLGIWNNVEEVLHVCEHFPVAGVDSTLPVAYGLRKQLLEPRSPKWLLMKEDWEYCPESELIMHMVNDPGEDYISKNIEAINLWIAKRHMLSVKSAHSEETPSFEATGRRRRTRRRSS